jgi:hypothetical protein
MSGLIAKLSRRGIRALNRLSTRDRPGRGQYDCILQFKGNGHLDVMRATVVNFGSARLERVRLTARMAQQTQSARRVFDVGFQRQ